MNTAKLFGNWILCLGVVCWVVGCGGDEEGTGGTTSTGMATTTTTPTTTTGGGDHDHAEGEADHDHAEGEEGHDHAEGEEGTDETSGDESTSGDAQASNDPLEIPETVTTETTEGELNLPSVEAGSTTGV